jgi:hypothetical protein
MEATEMAFPTVAERKSADTGTITQNCSEIVAAIRLHKNKNSMLLCNTPKDRTCQGCLTRDGALLFDAS